MKGNKERIVGHVDVNAAFLSWSAVDLLQRGYDTDLREIPSAIGGDPNRRSGIILAKSDKARQVGIVTGETIYSALKKCPNLTIVPPSYDTYVKASNELMNILKRFSFCVQRFSIDEAFYDYTNMDIHFGDPLEAAHTIKETIKKELGCSVSIGLSNNKLLAKMASDIANRDSIETLYPEEIQKKMWPLPVQNLIGVGRATYPKLSKIGIQTIGDLATFNKEYVIHKFKSHGEMLLKYANGIEDSQVKESNTLGMKGLGNSTTTPKDIEDTEEALKVLLSLTETTAMRLRATKFNAGLVSVSIRNNDFINYSHQRKLSSPTNTTNEIYKVVKDLFIEMWRGEPIRHFGVRLSDFCSSEFQQKSFWDNQNSEKDKSLDTVIDSIRGKYGSTSVMRGTFVNSQMKPLSGGYSHEEYPPMTSLL